jgi:putative FmdB family regulatory protein
MPVYEYRCASCGKRFSWLVGVVADAGEPRCPRCGGTSLKKLISRIARVRSEDDLLDNLDTPDLEEGGDKESMRRWAKRLGSEFGDELGGDFGEEFDQALEEDEATSETEEGEDEL